MAAISIPRKAGSIFACHLEVKSTELLSGNKVAIKVRQDVTLVIVGIILLNQIVFVIAPDGH